MEDLANGGLLLHVFFTGGCLSCWTAMRRLLPALDPDGNRRKSVASADVVDSWKAAALHEVVTNVGGPVEGCVKVHYWSKGSKKQGQRLGLCQHDSIRKRNDISMSLFTNLGFYDIDNSPWVSS